MIIKLVDNDGFSEYYECSSFHIQRKFDEETRREFSNPDKTLMLTVFGAGRKEPHSVLVNLAIKTAYIMNDKGQTIDKFYMPN